MLGRTIGPALMMMASAICDAQVPPHPMSDATSLRVANGKLEHVFSIPFRGDPTAVSKINGLESLNIARTSDGGAVRVMLDPGVPFPSEVTSVEVIESAGTDASQVIDPLQPPSTVPSRPGYRLVSTFRMPGRPRYLAAWRDERFGESSLTVWDEGNGASKSTLIATSSSPILGAAIQPSHDNPELTIVVWTRGRTAGDVVIGMYRWKDHSG